MTAEPAFRIESADLENTICRGGSHCAACCCKADDVLVFRRDQRPDEGECGEIEHSYLAALKRAIERSIVPYFER